MSAHKATRSPGVQKDTSTGRYCIVYPDPLKPRRGDRLPQTRLHNVAGTVKEAALLRSRLMAGEVPPEVAGRAPHLVSDEAGGRPAEMVVRELVAWYVEQKRREGRPAKTIDGYLDRLQRFLDLLGDVSISDRTRLVAGTESILATMAGPEGRLDGISGPCSENTLRRTHRAWAQVWNLAERHELVERNPVARVAVPTQAVADRAAEQVALTVEELDILLEATDRTEHSALYWTAAHTGNRPAELLGQTWENVDLDRLQWKVLNSVAYPRRGQPELKELKKRRQRRSIALDPATAERLRVHRRKQAEYALASGLGSSYNPRGLVFPSGPGGELWRVDSWGKHLERVLRELNEGGEVVRRITPKGFRHTHASHLMRYGKDPLAASRRLGHASVAFTLDKYGHELPGQQAEALVAVTEALEAARASRSGEGA